MNNCEAKWTWEVGERKTKIDYLLFSLGLLVGKMIIEDSGKNDMGSDHNFFWCEVKSGSMEEIVKRIRLKGRFNGRQDWEEYQQAVEEVFVGWEEELGSLIKGRDKSGKCCM